jgi:hypothetical protein
MPRKTAGPEARASPRTIPESIFTFGADAPDTPVLPVNTTNIPMMQLTGVPMTTSLQPDTLD